MSKIYKYFGSSVFELVFDKEGFCGVKCSLPEDYNDPYELFLAMDLNIPTEYLAFYNDVIQEMPQFPTSCFSKSPIVSPMWAHYANNHTGFAIEFDLEKLQQHFDENPFWDVDYREGPHKSLGDIVQRAAELKKPRYTYDLQRFAFSEAYFSKYAQWSYEEELRFVDTTGVTEKVAGNDILYIPMDCLVSVIIGSKSDENLITLSQEAVEESGLDWYQLVIGKSHPQPYFRSYDGTICTLKGGDILAHDELCDNCEEPINGGNEMCPWCSITEAHEIDAAAGNPFRLLSEAGQLEDYMRSMDAIHRK
ncbi:DUF2971 domain-containing protein [Vibrio lentus]|uniref:DUF2971 domain-containing protein n=1 Tax=Vibrio lentus TaxID=136468 RepID=UPI0010BDE083|nr:DUF2971 domain-containing protein [Vibrio lentus]TKF98952.1 DUF2971 domain-containing protein [Vibrio lentus]